MGSHGSPLTSLCPERGLKLMRLYSFTILAQPEGIEPSEVVDVIKSISHWEFFEAVNAMLNGSEVESRLDKKLMKDRKDNLVVICGKCVCGGGGGTGGESFNALQRDKAINLVDGKTFKIKNIPTRLKLTVQKTQFGRRKADWEHFYFKGGKRFEDLNEGERPDTMYIQNLPKEWFQTSIPCNSPQAPLENMEITAKTTLNPPKIQPIFIGDSIDLKVLKSIFSLAGPVKAITVEEEIDRVWKERRKHKGREKRERKEDRESLGIVSERKDRSGRGRESGRGSGGSGLTDCSASSRQVNVDVDSYNRKEGRPRDNKRETGKGKEKEKVAGEKVVVKEEKMEQKECVSLVDSNMFNVYVQYSTYDSFCQAMSMLSGVGQTFLVKEGREEIEKGKSLKVELTVDFDRSKFYAEKYERRREKERDQIREKIMLARKIEEREREKERVEKEKERERVERKKVELERAKREKEERLERERLERIERRRREIKRIREEEEQRQKELEHKAELERIRLEEEERMRKEEAEK
eukprot:Ihof_evm5s110 gene=Ihof_evmTU5s110